MPVEITLDHLITKEELLDVYRIFCKVYEIQEQETEKKRFLIKHYDCLIKNKYFNYKPFMMIKFFCFRRDFNYHFHAYNDDICNGPERDLKFQELVTKKFSELENKIEK